MEIEPSEVKEKEMQEESSGFFEKAFLTAAVVLMPMVDVEVASASGGEFGLLEGRSLALIHPSVMGGLFAYTVYAGYLGWQWRCVRTIQNDTTELKKQASKFQLQREKNLLRHHHHRQSRLKFLALLRKGKNFLKVDLRIDTSMLARSCLAWEYLSLLVVL